MQLKKVLGIILGITPTLISMHFVDCISYYRGLSVSSRYVRFGCRYNIRFIVYLFL